MPGRPLNANPLCVAVREIEISLTSPIGLSKIERAIDQAIADVGLSVALRASLAKFPGCIHWHAKQGRESGTLEITFWPRERRAWFTIQNGRRAAWIEEKLQMVIEAIHRRIDDT